MSLLRIYNESGAGHFKEFTEAEDIISALKPVSIRFERWQANEVLASDADQNQILRAYDESLKRIMKEVGFVTADVISVHSATPNPGELRKKFLNEHTHSEDEARFFVDGCGIFYIHPNQNVYLLVCEKGDFIDIPANTRHWFDMGPSPFLKAIRTFNTPEGWVADFTGSEIASKFPRFEEVL